MLLPQMRERLSSKNKAEADIAQEDRKIPLSRELPGTLIPQVRGITMCAGVTLLIIRHCTGCYNRNNEPE